jgi:hypothetical protein
VATKFSKGDRVSFVGDPATGDEAKGTVMQFISGTFNKYEVHTDRGAVLHLTEDELEATSDGGKKKSKD